MRRQCWELTSARCIGRLLFLVGVRTVLYVMNMAIDGFSWFWSLSNSLDASVFFNDGEIVIGSSAAVLTKSFPNNVINHPMHYLNNHKCCSDCNSGVVCFLSLLSRRPLKWMETTPCFAFPLPAELSAYRWRKYSSSASNASSIWLFSPSTAIQ